MRQKAEAQDNRNVRVLSGPKHRCDYVQGLSPCSGTINEIITCGHECHENPTAASPLGYSVTCTRGRTTDLSNMASLLAEGRRILFFVLFGNGKKKTIRGADLAGEEAGAGGPLPEEEEDRCGWRCSQGLRFAMHTACGSRMQGEVMMRWGGGGGGSTRYARCDGKKRDGRRWPPSRGLRGRREEEGQVLWEVPRNKTRSITSGVKPWSARPREPCSRRVSLSPAVSTYPTGARR